MKDTSVPAACHISLFDNTNPSEAASRLYELGLNVFPQPYGKKSGFPWKPLQYTRLPDDQIPTLFSGPCNIAVMCGHTSRNLFVLDCETDGSFSYHINQLKKRGIPLFAIKTARGGHLWLLCADGEVHSISGDVLGDAELRGRNQYVIAPPSRHPSDIDYQYFIVEKAEPPTVSIDDVDWLRDTAGNSIKLKVTRPRLNHPKSASALRAERIAAHHHMDNRVLKLSNQTLGYLESGTILAEGSRNNRLFAAACDLAGCGFDALEIKRYLTPIAQDSGIEAHEIAKTIDSACQQNRIPSRPQTQRSYTSRPLDWRYAQAYIQMAHWTGRTGSTDRMIALALVERAKLGSQKTGSFRASYRELGEKARVTNRRTIHKSLKRLQNRGFICGIRKDPKSGASCWRFTNEALQSGREALESGKCESEPLYSLQVGWNTNGSLSPDLSSRSTDAAERGAWGPEGLTVYQAMIKHGVPASSCEIAEFTGLTRDQVYYRLRKLRESGVIELSGKIWRVTLIAAAEELDEIVARPVGKLGKGQSRHERFARERQGYAAEQIMISRQCKDPYFNETSEDCVVASCAIA